ncbi:hypothetical protein GIB67_011664 [Kingdonia uniflora]|uniref:Heat shock protein 70 n=1 Tax=Kingdonia uniflora TaxID=39325 RepID=A0A7J7NA62_9MAGN|nr:hypothetical protein GIB67_011664 [Kingdonia uniflora]
MKCIVLEQKEKKKGVNPDEAVAFGAAVQGGILSGEGGDKTKDIFLLDVAPLTHGIETDQQTAVSIHVLEGERSLTKDCRELGQLDLNGNAPAPRGTPQIAVTFKVDANGILNVRAEDKAVGNQRKSLSLTKGVIKTATKEAVEWLDENQSAEKEDYEEKLKEVEAVYNPIITAVYQKSGTKLGSKSEAEDEDRDEL